MQTNHLQNNNNQSEQSISFEVKPSNFELRFGVSRVIGGRKYQEDEYTCVDYLSKRNGPALFAVFDGHGTDDFSAVASNTLYKIILESPLFKAGRYSEAIRVGFAEEDKMLNKRIESKRGGSTSTVSVIVGNELYIGHLGDSRAVLGVSDAVGYTHNFSSFISPPIFPVRISRDHKPDDPDERRRILEAGGVVVQGRVIGKDSAIDTSRALGDYDFKLPLNEARADFISSQPYVPEPIPLSAKHKFLVLASDGLWNQIDERVVIRTVDELWNAGMCPSEIADSITQRLAGPDGCDNVTMIVVFFIWDKYKLKNDDQSCDKVIISDHQSSVAQM